MRNHVWFKITTKLPFLFCTRCGLINLKNKATAKCMHKCEGRDEDE